MADTEAEEAPKLPGNCTAEMLNEGVMSLLKSDSWDTLTCARQFLDAFASCAHTPNQL